MQTRTFEEAFEEAVKQSNNKDISSQDVSLNSVNTHQNSTVLTTDVQKDAAISYTKSFQEYFGSSEEVTEGFLQRQKDILGFNLYILKKKSIWEALWIGLKSGKMNLNRRYQIKHLLFLVPLLIGPVYIHIFPTSFQFVLLCFFYITLQIPLSHIYLSILMERVLLYNKTQVYFNRGIKEAFKEDLGFRKLESNKTTTTDLILDFIENKLIHILPDLSNPLGWFKYVIVIPFSIYSVSTYSQYIDGYIFIFLFTLFSAYFRLFDKFIIFLLFIYFKIYFTVLDYFPHRFSLEDQERDFYLDIHKSGNTLISDLTTLETLINEFKEGTINPKMGTYLNKVLNQTSNLHNLIKDRGHFLKGKDQFQNFLHQLFNEILEKYANSYSLLEERIKKIEEGIDFSNLNEEEKNTLKNQISPILEKNKAQLSNLRRAILKKRLRE